VASDYWELENLGLPVFAEPSGDALNSYHLWRDDIDLAAELGFSAFRFSIEWARIEPARGLHSTAELARYREMIEHCRVRGLEPMVTLHHITHPAWFTKDGGWSAEGAVQRFVDYVAFVSPALRDVRYVTTINEPNIVATLGDLGAILRAADPAQAYVEIAALRPAGQSGVLGAATLPLPDEKVVAALIAAHRGAVDVLHRETSAQIGWTIAMQAFEVAPGLESAWAEQSRIWEDQFLEVSRLDDWLGVQSYTA
jgi:beta-glucosidase